MCNEPVHAGLHLDVEFEAEGRLALLEYLSDGLRLAACTAPRGNGRQQDLEGQLVGVIWCMSRLLIGEPYAAVAVQREYVWVRRAGP